jgi:glyoxylase-like metal-dependent hydrolase (beta-lactamase superfamily II)
MPEITRRAFIQSTAGSVAAVPFSAAGGPFAWEWKQQQPAPAPTVAARRALMATSPIVTTRLSDSLAMLSGPGGNVLVLSGSDGKVVVDTFVQPAWSELKRVLDQTSPAPVRTVIDTHWHFDHADNNDSFRQGGAVVLAHANTPKRMSETHVVMGMEMTPLPKEWLPTQTFTASHTLNVPEDRIEMRYVPPAHTDTDIWVHFTRANVLHLGDIYFNGGYPFIDTSTGGNINGQIEAASLALKMVDRSTRIVPGHGPVGDTSVLLKYRDMLVTVRDRVKKLKASGRTLDEVIAEQPTADLDAAWPAFVRPAPFIGVVYTTVT